MRLAPPEPVVKIVLLFEKDERGPDADLKLQFEVVSRLDPEEKKVIRSVIESIIYAMRRGRGQRQRRPGSEVNAGGVLPQFLLLKRNF
jgi:hypothetical protein